MKEMYKEAFSEIDEIFKLMPENLLNKIPLKFKDIIHNKKSIEYKPVIKEPIENCILKDETIIILALIYRDFLCNEAEKEQLKLRDAQKIKEAEDEIREKYNPDDIFKKRNNHKDIDANEKTKIVTETRITLIEEKWYKKLFNIVKRIFKKN